MFSDADQSAIRRAVEAAERKTRGEIVPMVVPASARYREASHLAGLVMALLVLALLLAWDYGWGLWLGFGSYHGVILLGVVAAYVLGRSLGTLPWCIRLLTPTERMAYKVRLRAERAFYEEGLHKTRESTGILIMVSVLEHQVQILADRGIHERVPAGTWDSLVNDIVRGIRAGQAAEALCQAILRCGEILAIPFPAPEGDNRNELRNDLIRGT